MEVQRAKTLFAWFLENEFILIDFISICFSLSYSFLLVYLSITQAQNDMKKEASKNAYEISKLFVPCEYYLTDINSRFFIHKILSCLHACSLLNFYFPPNLQNEIARVIKHHVKQFSKVRSEKANQPRRPYSYRNT